MALNLYDSQGYEIKLEMTKTFNPSKAGVSGDIRDLGVFGGGRAGIRGDYLRKGSLCI